ncbi:MAG: hypothetical protein HC837_20865 [Chloroflexaceae bacterium]|nr:hypothetical protein [Chloroflexaceae bacterium]
MIMFGEQNITSEELSEIRHDLLMIQAELADNAPMVNRLEAVIRKIEIQLEHVSNNEQAFETEVYLPHLSQFSLLRQQAELQLQQ